MLLSQLQNSILSFLSTSLLLDFVGAFYVPSSGRVANPLIHSPSALDRRQSQYAICDARSPNIRTQIHHGQNEINYGNAYPWDVISSVIGPGGPCLAPPMCSIVPVTNLPTSIVGDIKHGKGSYPINYTFSVNVTESHYGTLNDLKVLLWAGMQSLNDSNAQQGAPWDDKHDKIHPTHGYPTQGNNTENWNTDELIVSRDDGGYTCELLHIKVTIPGFQPVQNNAECDAASGWMANTVTDVAGKAISGALGLPSDFIGEGYFGKLVPSCG